MRSMSGSVYFCLSKLVLCEPPSGLWARDRPTASRAADRREVKRMVRLW